MPFVVLKDASVHTAPPSAIPHVHPAGSVLEDDEVDPVVQQRFRDRDPHVRAILAAVSDDEAHELRTKRLALEIFLERTRDDRTVKPEPPSRVMPSTPARSLRWAGNNPGDAEHAGELEDRLTRAEQAIADFDRRMSRLERTA